MLYQCHYIAIQCPCAGPGLEMRQGLAATPRTKTVVCPDCRKRRPFIVLGVGLTSRLLPFHELYRLSGSSAAVGADGEKRIPWGGNGIDVRPAGSKPVHAGKPRRTPQTPAVNPELLSVAVDERKQSKKVKLMNHPRELELAILALLFYRDAPVNAAGLVASLRKHNAFEPEALENIAVVLDSLCSLGQVECTTSHDSTSTYRLTDAGRNRLRARLAQGTER